MPELMLDKAAALRAANDSARLVLKKLASKDAAVVAMIAATEAADTASREAEAAVRPIEPMPAQEDAEESMIERNVEHLKLVVAQFAGMDVSILTKALEVAELSKEAAALEAASLEPVIIEGAISK